jgi:hypothetical protein
MDKIKVTLYGKTTEYDSRSEAESFLLDCMMNSEGSEQGRYTEAYLQLKEGLTEVSDGE